MLGLVLDGVVTALRMLPTVNATSHPRMADFAKVGTAAETAYWPAGTFMSAYRHNIAGVVDDTLEADPVAVALMAFMAEILTYTATAEGWLSVLVPKGKETEAKSNNFPKNGRALSSRFKRAAPFLEEIGLVMTTSRANDAVRTRNITFTRINKVSYPTDDTGE